MYFYILSGILILLVILSIRFEKKPTIDKWISKENGDVLKGVSMIVIFLHHMVKYAPKGSLFYLIFGNIGFLGSSIFLFISGYGLLYSFKNKKDYLKNFLFKRVLNLYIIFVIAGFIIFMFGYFDNIVNIFIRKDWFITIIIYYYIIFYFSYKFIKNEKGALITNFIACFIYIIACLCLNLDAYWFNTAICFPMGILCMNYKEKIFDILNKKYLLKFISLALIFLIFTFLNVTGLISNLRFLQYIVPVIFILLVMMVLIRFNFKSKIFKFISSISLEIYLLHQRVTEFVIGIFNLNKANGGGVILGLIVTLVGGFLISEIMKELMKGVKVIRNKYSM